MRPPQTSHAIISMFAPAKLNLYLHITGRQADGYHDLDSLVAFAGLGDEIRLEHSDSFTFTIEGPHAATLKNEPTAKNLVVKAATSLADLTGKPLNVKITLIKNLPVASGIGGGSSDAAAALRALAHHWGLADDDERLYSAAARHGQDVPACLKLHTNYLTAKGIEPGPNLPHTDIVLVNPNKPLPTPDVYKAYRDKKPTFSAIAQLEDQLEDVHELVIRLKARRNDLFHPALSLMPEIAAVVESLEKTENCLLARMSGSGATCFGLYGDRGTARKAASDILTAHPGWWVVPSYLPFRRGISTDIN